MSSHNHIKPVILGCSGIKLTTDEITLFQATNPAGFILFQRNCASPSQVQDLISELRGCVGRRDAPILIDQEGGSVARLKSPMWREYPSAGFFHELIEKQGLKQAQHAVYLNAQLMGLELAELGVTVNCAPVLDVPSTDCHEFLSGSRTFHDDADIVSVMGKEICDGLLYAGVLPVIKHIPGHGRGQVDSHKGLPVVDALRTDLEDIDFKPFKDISSLKYGANIWAMAAHILYNDLDKSEPASTSKYIVDNIIRTEIGFDGVLLADDISMEALEGGLAEKAVKTIEAGMDLTMHCNGEFDEMAEILTALPIMTEQAKQRMDRAEKQRLLSMNTEHKSDLENRIMAEFEDIIKKQEVA